MQISLFDRVWLKDTLYETNKLNLLTSGLLLKVAVFFSFDKIEARSAATLINASLNII